MAEEPHSEVKSQIEIKDREEQSKIINLLPFKENAHRWELKNAIKEYLLKRITLTYSDTVYPELSSIKIELSDDIENYRYWRDFLRNIIYEESIDRGGIVDFADIHENTFTVRLRLWIVVDKKIIECFF